MMADDEVDLNPLSTNIEVKKKRPRPLESPPEDGSLFITVFSIVLRGGSDTFTKSRFSREIVIPVAQKFITSPNTVEPIISSGTIHGLIVDYFGSLADETIAKITSGDGDVSEHSLVGDSHADYKVCFTNVI